MKSLHLTIMVFCHVLLASVVFYFTSLTEASPLTMDNIHKQPFMDAKHPGFVLAKAELKPQIPPSVLAAVPAIVASPESPAAAKPKVYVESKPEAKSAAASPQTAPVVAAVVPQVIPSKQVSAAVQSPSEPVAAKAAAVEPAQLVLTERKAELKEASKQESPVVAESAKQEDVPAVKSAVAESVPVVEPLKPTVYEEVAKSAPSDFVQVKKVDAPTSPLETPPKYEEPASRQVAAPVVPSVVFVEKAKPVVDEPQSAALMAAEYKSDAPVAEVRPIQEAPKQVEPAKSAPEPSVVVKEVDQQQQVKPSMMSSPEAPLTVADQSGVKSGESKPVAPVTVTMGGLGPLHLLATTLCSYQPDKSVADENLNQLYARRASVRKSLFEFMSLKFTNLEKLSSRLGYGLQVVPVKSSVDNKSPGVAPSHGWPVVGKCTAHDLKLMGEAAWCECNDNEQGCPSKPTDKANADEGQPAAKITSNQHVSSTRLNAARSIAGTNSFLPSPEESSVISKLLHVTDIKDAPTVESTIYNLNLTQHQLATLEAHATSTQECRRNSLRYTKALFNHLAEDQKEVSETWPKLYALISADDCARKRMIDIVSALSSFRTDTTSIRRDNLEFAFAMDDLRAKVLESEVNVPLTFDRDFIEVEQFLQQSVRLMLANVQPKRAKVTSMRYRSLMYGASQQAFDDQCIDLHQRLLARNYPSDCNPTQFGQLPDVLRMTASSLELWSIEKQLSLHTAKNTDYPNSNAVGQQKVKDDVNECIANLVSS